MGAPRSGLAGGSTQRTGSRVGQPLDESVLGALDRIVVDAGEPHDEGAGGLLGGGSMGGYRPGVEVVSGVGAGELRLQPGPLVGGEPSGRDRVGEAGKGCSPAQGCFVDVELAVGGGGEAVAVRHDVVAELPERGA